MRGELLRGIFAHPRRVKICKLQSQRESQNFVFTNYGYSLSGVRGFLLFLLVICSFSLSFSSVSCGPHTIICPSACCHHFRCGNSAITRSFQRQPIIDHFLQSERLYGVDFRLQPQGAETDPASEISVRKLYVRRRLL